MISCEVCHKSMKFGEPAILLMYWNPDPASPVPVARHVHESCWKDLAEPIQQEMLAKSHEINVEYENFRMKLKKRGLL